MLNGLCSKHIVYVSMALLSGVIII